MDQGINSHIENRRDNKRRNECHDLMDFSLHFNSHNGGIYLKKLDKNCHLPPRDFLVGEDPATMQIDQIIEKFILEDINWLPITRLQSLLKPMNENFDPKNAFTLDTFERFYTLERIRKNGQEYIDSINVDDRMMDKPLMLTDSVALGNIIDRAQENSNFPTITPTPGETIEITYPEFFKILDLKSKQLTEEIFSSQKNNIDHVTYDDPLINITDTDISTITSVKSHSQFIKELSNEREHLDENTTIRTEWNRNICRPSKSIFVRQVKFRDDIPQFETLRNNMAFKYPFELDPFQKEAILLLEQQQNVLVSAHTSAGKTVVAEYAIAMSVKHGMKTIYTSPIKALSNQKYKDFKKSFDSVGIITGDIQLNPNASCVIMTTEILRAMLYQSSSTSLSDVEWVVFDEVHYINDEQRGVVWEELLIMLPREIKLVLLSATFPNCLDFANWIGSTRQQVIHVLMTTKRPVPLEHYVYTATNRSSLDDCFSISDERGKFKKEGVCRAIDSLRQKSNKPIKYVVVKNRNISLNKSDGVKCLMEYLIKNDKIPVIFFVFSKDACLHYAKSATYHDYTTKNEKSQIISFFNTSINRLSSENLNLPQINDLKYCLERGIAVHHSGILPILREIVEILFQKSLIKVLFATETFSIGVNVPARTVVFLTLNKPSDTGRRDLYSSEYIQMAGRAGRRGKDKSGTVIILSSEQNELESIESIINGQPSFVKSKFCLTYGMILRMLSKKSGNIVKVEDLMRSSFSEFGGESKADTANTFLDKIAELENGINVSRKDINECGQCQTAMEKFYNFYKELNEYQTNALGMLLCTPTTTKEVLKTGRLCVVKLTSTQFSIGIVSEEYESVKFINNNIKGRNIPMLIFVHDSQVLKHQFLTKIISSPIDNPLYPYLGLGIMTPSNMSRVFYLKVHHSNIILICDKKIKIQWNSIIKDKRITDNRENAHAKSNIIKSTINSLSSIIEDIGLKGVENVLKPFDVTKYSTDFDDMYTINHYMELLTKLWSKCDDDDDMFICTQCPNFVNHYDIFECVNKKEAEIEELKFKLSDESLQLLPEYNSRLQILRALGFIDQNNSLLLKGKLSNKFKNNFGVILTELLVSKELIDMNPPYIAAALSCFVQENAFFKQKPLPKFSPDLEKVWNIIVTIDQNISIIEQKNGLEFNRRYIYPDLIIPMYHWSSGASFADIVYKHKIPEGVLVRHVLRLDEICSEMELAALYAGNPELNVLIKKTREAIHKDIIFTPSLYLT